MARFLILRCASTQRSLLHDVQPVMLIVSARMTPPGLTGAVGFDRLRLWVLPSLLTKRLFAAFPSRTITRKAATSMLHWVKKTAHLERAAFASGDESAMKVRPGTPTETIGDAQVYPRQAALSRSCSVQIIHARLAHEKLRESFAERMASAGTNRYPFVTEASLRHFLAGGRKLDAPNRGFPGPDRRWTAARGEDGELPWQARFADFWPSAGGVVVAFEIAEALHTPLDAFVVRKLGVPGQEELAMGAMASGGVLVRI